MKYFILDTSANLLVDGNKTYEEKDFVNYIWKTNRFNKIREGDKFIYRRPQNASEIKGEFYFFGAGEIAKIQRNISLRVPAKVNGKLENCIIFDNYLKKSDLESFKWDFKQRKKGSWGHFFNQYGMNEITEEDYNNLISLVEYNYLEKNEEILAYEDAQIEIGKNNYYVEDTHSLVKTRQYHHVFAQKVKQNYDYKCPITGIDELSFLRASHIIPWSEKKETRLDPKNGICLYCDIDLAFDRGYISFDPSTFKLTFSEKLYSNKNLYNKLKQYEGMELKINYKYAPKKEYLEWHYKKYIL